MKLDDPAFASDYGGGLATLEYVATHLAIGQIPPAAVEQLVGPPPADQNDAVAVAKWVAKGTAKFRCMVAAELLAEAERIRQNGGCQ